MSDSEAKRNLSPEHIGDQPRLASLVQLSPSTLAIHADDHLNPESTDIAPSLHVSTTFRYATDPAQLVPYQAVDYATHDTHVYSRETTPNTTRLEALLSALLNNPTLTYASGLAAVHAILVFLNPKSISIGNGYHGTHGVIGLLQKLTGVQKLPLDCEATDLNAGDVIWLETPVNPTGEAFCIERYARKAHERGAYLVIDSTFGPPGLQDGFAEGADVVMHSGTKYLGGHSDMLCGILSVKSERKGWFQGLAEERVNLGSVMGGLEAWLGVRSIRTLQLRVRRQSDSATELVRWLDQLLHPEQSEASQVPPASVAVSKIIRSVVDKVTHASLQRDDMEWLRKQMSGGFGPVFAVYMKNEHLARYLPSKLSLFHHATSLGGVESLIEWRTMSDATCDRSLLRVSIGLESWEDLRDDLLRGFTELSRAEAAHTGAAK